MAKEEILKVDMSAITVSFICKRCGSMVLDNFKSLLNTRQATRCSYCGLEYLLSLELRHEKIEGEKNANKTEALPG